MDSLEGFSERVYEKKRQPGGIEPLCLSTARELRSRAITRPPQAGQLDIACVMCSMEASHAQVLGAELPSSLKATST